LNYAANSVTKVKELLNFYLLFIDNYLQSLHEM
jgi:hypothetical protein